MTLLGPIGSVLCEAAQLALDAAGGEGEIKYAWVSRDRGVTASERNMS